MARARDVVIVGSGRGGLVAAAYLARSGLDTLVCERRGVVGGAAVSEHPFGPGYTVTSLSYVAAVVLLAAMCRSRPGGTAQAGSLPAGSVRPVTPPR